MNYNNSINSIINIIKFILRKYNRNIRYIFANDDDFHYDNILLDTLNSNLIILLFIINLIIYICIIFMISIINISIFYYLLST